MGSCSPKSTGIIVWPSVNAYWTAMLTKVKLFLTRIVTGDETWVHHFAPESKRQSMEWKYPGSPVKKKIQESTFCGKSVAHNFLGLTRGNTGTLSGKGRNSKQCTVLWDAEYRTETCNSNETPRSIVRCSVVAWQCAPTYCHPHSSNSCETGFYGVGTSCMQSRSRPLGLPSFWSTSRCLKGPSIHLWRRSEESGAWVACCSAKDIFF